MFKKKNKSEVDADAVNEVQKPPSQTSTDQKQKVTKPAQANKADKANISDEGNHQAGGSPEKVATQNASAAFINQHLALYQNNQSLKKQVNLLILLLLLLAFVFGILLWAFLYQYPKYRYIATTNNEAICKVATQNRPSITPAALENFAQEAILDVYRYDYVNFEDQVQKALNRFFTFNGKASFFQSLANSGNFEKVKANKLISKATVLRSAQIEKEEVRYGRYQWQIAVPIKIEFYVGNSEVKQESVSSQNFLVVMTVVQELANRINPKGVAVDALVLKPM